MSPPIWGNPLPLLDVKNLRVAYGSLEAVKGIQLYLKEARSPVTLWLVGDEDQIRPLLQEYAIPAASVQVVQIGRAHV